jgi:predicted metalloendopeptidase
MEGKPRPAVIDGFSPEQRFFLGYAQAWRELARPEYLRLLVTTDPHSPAKYRVIGPLSNLPEFAAAFSCSEGTPMVRPAALRPAIW